MREPNSGEVSGDGIGTHQSKAEVAPNVLLRRQQLETLYGNWRVGVAGHLIVGALVGLFFWPVADKLLLAGWYAALCVSVGVRIVVLRRFKTATRTGPLPPEQGDAWLKHLLTVTFLHGAIWGCAGPLLVPDASLHHASIMVLALAAVGAGTIVSLSAHLGAVVTFVVPALVPYGLIMTMSHSVENRSLGIAILCYAVAGMLHARAISKTTRRAMRTQADNARLIARLEDEQRAIAELNRQLNADIARRKAVEIELRVAKAHAERMADRLSLASALDDLTGLAGSRHFEDVLKREWTRAARGGTPLAVILCDVDAFPDYCERYGNGRGDELLRLVGHVLLLHARRANDLVARTGEQRFALLMPLAETAQAIAVAEQIHAAVETLALDHGASPFGDKVTVSLGVASLIPQKGMPFKILEQTADNMLRTARDAGHNRIHAFSPMSA